MSEIPLLELAQVGQPGGETDARRRRSIVRAGKERSARVAYKRVNLWVDGVVGGMVKSECETGEKVSGDESSVQGRANGKEAGTDKSASGTSATWW